MNRRNFIQSMAAVVSLPVNSMFSLRPLAAAAPMAVEVPAHVRSWAVYMSTLHGECPPAALRSLVNIPEADARAYLGRLIADGVIKKNPLLQNSVRRAMVRNDFSASETVEKSGRVELESDADQRVARASTQNDVEPEQPDDVDEAIAREDVVEAVDVVDAEQPEEAEQEGKS